MHRAALAFLLCAAATRTAHANEPADASNFVYMLDDTVAQNYMCACQDPEPDPEVGKVGLVRRRPGYELKVSCAVPCVDSAHFAS